MNVTVNVICYKSKVLKNSESPLMIRVCKDKKRKYISLGLSIKPIHWDFTKNAPKSKCPSKEALTTLIAQKLHSYSEQIMEFKAATNHSMQQLHTHRQHIFQNSPLNITLRRWNNWKIL